METLPCTICKTNEYVSTECNYDNSYSTYCGSCYDCDLDGESNSYYSTNTVAHGKTKRAAIEAWNSEMLDAMEPV